MSIYVDHTHLGRHVTGLERITLELFSASALAPLDIVPVTAQGTRQMVTKQTFGLPVRLAASLLDPAVSGLSAEPVAAAVCVARAALYSRHLPAVAAGRPQPACPALHGGTLPPGAAPLPAFSRQFQRYQAEACRPLPARRRDHALSAAGPQRVRSRFEGARRARPPAAAAGGAWNRGAAQELCRGGEDNRRVARARLSRTQRWTSSGGRAGATTGSNLRPFPA